MVGEIHREGESGWKAITILLRMSSEDGGRWQDWKKGMGLKNIGGMVKVIKFGDLLVRKERDLENLISSLLWRTWCH